MTIKAFELTLPGLIIGLSSGWYYNQLTGDYQYYDAISGQWYIYVAGMLVPMATQWVDAATVYTGAPVGVKVGDTVRINVTFSHQGSVGTYRLYGAIGIGALNPGTGYDSGAFIEGSPAGTKSFTTTNDTSAKTYTQSADVVVPSSCDGTPLTGKLAALYVKIINGVSLELYKTLSVYLRGALSVASDEAVFSNLNIVNWNKV